MKKAVLKLFAILKSIQYSIFNFHNIKKRLQHRFFPLNITKLFKNTYFEEHLLIAASGF